MTGWFLTIYTAVGIYAPGSDVPAFQCAALPNPYQAKEFCQRDANLMGPDKASYAFCEQRQEIDLNRCATR